MSPYPTMDIEDIRKTTRTVPLDTRYRWQTLNYQTFLGHLSPNPVLRWRQARARAQITPHSSSSSFVAHEVNKRPAAHAHVVIHATKARVISRGDLPTEVFLLYALHRPSMHSRPPLFRLGPPLGHGELNDAPRTIRISFYYRVPEIAWNISISLVWI